MKSSVKARENDDSQYYKFRSRIIDIEDIFEGDVPSLSDIDSDVNAGPDNEEKLELEFFKIMVFQCSVFLTSACIFTLYFYIEHSVFFRREVTKMMVLMKTNGILFQSLL